MKNKICLVILTVLLLLHQSSFAGGPEIHGPFYDPAAVAITGGNITGATYGAAGTLTESELLTLGDGATTEILVGGGAGTTSTGTVETIQAPIHLGFFGKPRTVLITGESADILMTVGGILPAITQNYGLLVYAPKIIKIKGINNIRGLRAINAVNNNGAILKYELYW